MEQPIAADLDRADLVARRDSRARRHRSKREPRARARSGRWSRVERRPRRVRRSRLLGVDRQRDDERARRRAARRDRSARRSDGDEDSRSTVHLRGPACGSKAASSRTCCVPSRPRRSSPRCRPRRKSSRSTSSSSLSQRAAATLRDDMSSAQPKRLSEVEAAQKEIIEATLRLAGEGKITLPARGGEE